MASGAAPAAAVRAAGAGAAAACGGSAGRGADLLASSSAMIRRMEARISSIDGSCDFAGCVMRASSPVRFRSPDTDRRKAFPSAGAAAANHRRQV
jgi:glycerate-2-kinase